MRLQVSLTPAEGKRIIGMSVAAMDTVQHTLEEGTIVIATSTTTAHILEELLGVEIEDKCMFTTGVITARSCCITDPKGRYEHQVIRRRKVKEMTTKELPKVSRRWAPRMSSSRAGTP